MGPSTLVASSRDSGNHGLFVVFVALHIASAIIGSGAIALSGVYGGTARHLERAGSLDEARRWFSTANAAALALLAVPFLGVAGLIAGGRTAQLGHAWVIAALVIWVAMSGLLTGVVRPAERLLGELLSATEVDLRRAEGQAQRLSLAAAGCDLGFVVALGLMIWQP